MMSYSLGHRSFVSRHVSLYRCRYSYRSRQCATVYIKARLTLRTAPKRASPWIAASAKGPGSEAEGEQSSGAVSGEWPMNWSFASYEDLSDYYGGKVLKEEGMGGYHLSDVMSKDLILTTPKTKREELVRLFEEHTGLPVVDGKGRLLGVVSRSDLQREGDTVKELMSKPPIAAKPTARVADAACLMLKHKIHRIPIVGNDAAVLGFVTRTDIFEALEAETEISEGIPK